MFAGGCPRSGLTLLRRLLDAHSRIHCGPDTGLPPAIALQRAVDENRIDVLEQHDGV